MKLFHFNRKEDISGNSGTGIVAQGVVFDNGRVALTWLTKIPTISIYENIEDCIFLHGHDGATEIEYLFECKFKE